MLSSRTTYLGFIYKLRRGFGSVEIRSIRGLRVQSGSASFCVIRDLLLLAQRPFFPRITQMDAD
jgi:hypothetical protein